MCCNAGVSIHEVQRLLGHRDVTTTMPYAVVAHQRWVEAQSLLSRRFRRCGRAVDSSYTFAVN
jgi:integrase